LPKPNIPVFNENNDDFPHEDDNQLIDYFKDDKPFKVLAKEAFQTYRKI